MHPLPPLASLPLFFLLIVVCCCAVSEPMDHGAAFNGWLYASHHSYPDSTSVSSIAPSGPSLLQHPALGGPTASPSLSALPPDTVSQLLAGAAPASASAPSSPSAPAPTATTASEWEQKALTQLHTRLTRNSQVLLYSAEPGAALRAVSEQYVSAVKANHSVTLWFTHASTHNALWRQYAVLAGRLGLRSLSLVCAVL